MTEQINKYQNGKIYKIRDRDTGAVYIGSTTQKLSQRMSGHRREYKNWMKTGKGCFLSSFEILKNNNYDYFLLHNFPCNNKEELHAEEQRVIDIEENCVNIQKAFVSVERREYNKQYYNENIDEIKNNVKKYRLKNIDKIKEKKSNISLTIHIK